MNRTWEENKEGNSGIKQPTISNHMKISSIGIVRYYT